MLFMIESLGFSQAKGFMYVDSVQIDYNDFSKPKDMFRLKRRDSDISSEKGDKPYAVYYVEGE